MDNNRLSSPVHPSYIGSTRPQIMRCTPLLAVLFGLLLLACSGKAPDPSIPAPAPPPQTGSTADDEWLMGDSVLAVMGDVHGLIIVDLFAGDGYYTEKLLDAGARVLAIDDDLRVLGG